MPYEIRRYQSSDWHALAKFIHEHWQANHPILRRPLFDWQYAGYGPLSDGMPCVDLAWWEGELVAFLGTMPAQFRADGKVYQGVFLAMWMARPDHRNAGIGLMLLRAVQKRSQVVAVLGVNETAAHIYRRLGYQDLGDLHRWVAPLSPLYRTLLVPETATRVADDHIQQWQSERPHAAPAIPCPIAPERLWRLQKVQGDNVGGPLRSKQFYQWRYVQSPVHTYQMVETSTGVALVRIERSADPGAAKVLRILELIPAGTDENLGCSLVASVLRWGASIGCSAADYQDSSTWFARSLAQAGMRQKHPQDPATMLGELFRPWRPRATPINGLCKAPVDVSQWRLLKVDGDMDRPNDPADWKEEST